MNTKFSPPNLSSPYLHLGCGLNAPETWLNIDGSWQVWFAQNPKIKKILVQLQLYPRSQAEIPWLTNILRLDLRKTLPFENDRFSAVYSSHTLEHLFREEAFALIKECYRVLKSGGVCRIVVPDLAAAIQRYIQQSTETNSDIAADDFMDELLVHTRSQRKGLIGFYHNLLGYHQHKWMYDANSLKKLLIDAGFCDVQNYDCHQGRLPELLEIEELNRIENRVGVIAEGIKP